jgi:hypothetical protein
MLASIQSSRSALAALAFVVAACCSMIAVPPAHGGAVPESAYSRSLGISPLLLDDFGLAFRFPQLGARYPAQATALGVSGNTSGNTTGIGAAAYAGRNALFILNQPAAGIGPLVGRTRAFQLGWGREFDAVRLGVAVRGSRSVDGIESTSGSSGNERGDFTNSNAHVIEGALGFGLGDADSFLDLVVELRNQETDWDRQRSYYSPSDSTVMRVRREMSADLSPGIALRLGRTLDSGVRLVAAGSWTEDLLEGETAVQYNEQSTRISDGDYVRRWSVGFAGTGSPARAGDLTVFGEYDRQDREFSDASTSSVSRSANTLDVGLIGVAIERTIWRRLEGLAGLRAQYTRAKYQDDRWALTYPGAVHVESRLRETEAWTDRFGWGLAYRHDRFEVIGAMDARLNLENLVLTLDARFLF